MKTLPSFARVQTSALCGLVLCLGLTAPSAQAQTEISPAPPGEAAALGAPVPAAIAGATPPETTEQAPEAPLTTSAAAANPTESVPPAVAANTEAPRGPEAPLQTQAEPNTTEQQRAETTGAISMMPRTAPKPRVRGDARAPFSFGVGGGVVWNRDSAYDKTDTGGSTPQFDVMLSYDVLELTPRLVVSLGVSHRRGFAESDVYAITDNTLQAELLARFTGASWLWPHARASVGGAFTRLEVPNIGDAGTIEANNAALASSFGGGLTLKTPTRAFENRNGTFASLSFGILVEGGYTLGKAAAFSGTLSGGTDDVARSKVRLGSLDRNAPYLRVLLVTRF